MADVDERLGKVEGRLEQMVEAMELLISTCKAKKIPDLQLPHVEGSWRSDKSASNDGPSPRSTPSSSSPSSSSSAQPSTPLSSSASTTAADAANHTIESSRSGVKSFISLKSSSSTTEAGSRDSIQMKAIPARRAPSPPAGASSAASKSAGAVSPLSLLSPRGSSTPTLPSVAKGSATNGSGSGSEVLAKSPKSEVDSVLRELQMIATDTELLLSSAPSSISSPHASAAISNEAGSWVPARAAAHSPPLASETETSSNHDNKEEAPTDQTEEEQTTKGIVSDLLLTSSFSHAAPTEATAAEPSTDQPKKEQPGGAAPANNLDTKPTSVGAKPEPAVAVDASTKGKSSPKTLANKTSPTTKPKKEEGKSSSGGGKTLGRSRSFVLPASIKKAKEKKAEMEKKMSRELDPLHLESKMAEKEAADDEDDDSADEEEEEKEMSSSPSSTQSTPKKQPRRKGTIDRGSGSHRRKRDFFKRKGKELEREKEKEKEKDKVGDKPKNSGDGKKGGEDKEKKKKAKKKGMTRSGGVLLEPSRAATPNVVEIYTASRLGYQKEEAERWGQFRAGPSEEAAETLEKDNHFYHLNVYYLATSPDIAHKFFVDLHAWVSQKEKEMQQQLASQHPQLQTQQPHGSTSNGPSSSSSTSTSTPTQVLSPRRSTNASSVQQQVHAAEEENEAEGIGPIWVTTPKLVARVTSASPSSSTAVSGSSLSTSSSAAELLQSHEKMDLDFG